MSLNQPACAENCSLQRCLYRHSTLLPSSLQGLPLKKVVKYAAARGFTDLAVFNEDRKRINGLLLVHLPSGPTAHFKLSSLVLSKDIKARACHWRPVLL